MTVPSKTARKKAENEIYRVILRPDSNAGSSSFP
jgi:hypothetical protein